MSRAPSSERVTSLPLVQPCPGYKKRPSCFLFFLFNVSWPLTELYFCSPRESLPEGSRQSRASVSDSPVHPGPQREYTPSERARSPAPVVPDVPLAVVRDIIPALLRNETSVESVELICAVHGLGTFVTESITQIVMENSSPARGQQRCVVLQLLLPRDWDLYYPTKA